MFFYYGAKHRAAFRYPPPRYGTIVEPFAGSAGYSMAHLARVDRVILVEKSDRVVNLWRRLLSMSVEDVAALPSVSAGEDTDDLLVMVTMASNAVASSSRLTVTPRMCDKFETQRRRIMRLLPMAKAKVEVIHGDYRTAPDIEATFFVDPPYAVRPDKTGGRGSGYGRGCSAKDLDFGGLAEWATTRRGQVVVCEAADADWLPFKPLYTHKDTLTAKKAEGFWSNDKVTLF